MKARGMTIAAEKIFENNIKKWLHSVGIYPAGYPDHKKTVPAVGWYVKIWGGGYQKSGIADLLLNVNGYFVAAELKAPNGTPSELQLKNIRDINATRGFGFALYPSAFESFKRFIIDLTADTYNRDEIPEIWK